MDFLYLFWGLSAHFSAWMLIFIFSLLDIFILFVTSPLKSFIIERFDSKCINNCASCLVHSNEENRFPVERVRINYRFRCAQKKQHQSMIEFLIGNSLHSVLLWIHCLHNKLINGFSQIDCLSIITLISIYGTFSIFFFWSIIMCLHHLELLKLSYFFLSLYFLSIFM